MFDVCLNCFTDKPLKHIFFEEMHKNASLKFVNFNRLIIPARTHHTCNPVGETL